ncbi:MAG: AAA family ATPase [Betaproteobacteria bacterium]|nr:AAA family ATPase [Betaproteobacteria bacterium]
MSSQCDFQLACVALKQAGFPVRELARRAGVNPAVAYRAIRQGYLPIRNKDKAERVMAAVHAAHFEIRGNRPPASCEEPKRNLNAVQIEENPPDGVAASGGHPEAVSHQLFQEVEMLIQKPTLTPAARQAFHISGNCFMPPDRKEAVFLGGDMRVVYEHMLAKARYGGLLAVIGESGSGKSTLKDLLVTDLAAEGEVVVIEPHTQRMEETDKAGKTLKGADIVQAIMAEVAPGIKQRQTAEAQLKQVAACLADSQSASKNRRHLLIIEETHCLPKPTLRHLKRFLEMKNPAVKGLQRPMLSIVLLGQPELADRLSPYDQSVREVWQRCEVVHLPPLGKSLSGYINHRLGLATNVLEPAAVDELSRLLTDRSGRSYAYPLAVDNWLMVILNASVGLGKSITAAHVTEAHAETIKALRGAR